MRSRYNQDFGYSVYNSAFYRIFCMEQAYNQSYNLMDLLVEYNQSYSGFLASVVIEGLHAFPLERDVMIFVHHVLPDVSAILPVI
jgi:hypothetical protein